MERVSDEAWNFFEDDIRDGWTAENRCRKDLLECTRPFFQINSRCPGLINPCILLQKKEYKLVRDRRIKISWLTNKSLGVFLLSGSFNRQLSINDSATLGYRPSGVSRGAGSFTICCNNSKILIVIPPPCRLTPLLFRLAFLFCIVFFRRAGGRPESDMDPGRAGDSVPS